MSSGFDLNDIVGGISHDHNASEQDRLENKNSVEEGDSANVGDGKGNVGSVENEETNENKSVDGKMKSKEGECIECIVNQHD